MVLSCPPSCFVPSALVAYWVSSFYPCRSWFCRAAGPCPLCPFLCGGLLEKKPQPRQHHPPKREKQPRRPHIPSKIHTQWPHSLQSANRRERGKDHQKTKRAKERSEAFLPIAFHRHSRPPTSGEYICSRLYDVLADGTSSHTTPSTNASKHHATTATTIPGGPACCCSTPQSVSPRLHPP